MNIYELNQELAIAENLLDEWAIEHEGDITDFPLFEEMEKIELMKNDKALGVGVWIKNLTAESDALAREAKTIAARKKALANKIDSLESYILSIVMPGEKLSNSRCKIGWRKSSTVELLVDENDLPERFQKTTITADKAGLKSATEEEREGIAYIKKNENLQIK